MKNKIIFIIFILSIFCCLNTYGTQSINASKASSHIGEYMIVCGTVADIVKLKKRTVINIGRKYPYEDICFVIWDDNIYKFNNKFGNLNELIYNDICASGIIKTYKNHLQLILDKPENIIN